MNLQKLAGMRPEDYDRPILSADEIGNHYNATYIALCEKHGVKFRVLASETIHTKSELEALKKITPTFREEQAHASKIERLKVDVEALEAKLNEILLMGVAKEDFQKKELAKKAAFDKITPLFQELKNLSTRLVSIETEIGLYRQSHDVIPDGHLALLADKAIIYARSGRADS